MRLLMILALTGGACLAQTPQGTQRFAALKDYLALSDAQVTSLTQILQQQRTNLQSVRQQMRTDQQKLRELIRSGSHDRERTVSFLTQDMICYLRISR